MGIGLAGFPGAAFRSDPDNMAPTDRPGRSYVVEVHDQPGGGNFRIDGIFIGFYSLDTIKSPGFPPALWLVKGIIEETKRFGELK